MYKQNFNDESMLATCFSLKITVNIAGMRFNGPEDVVAFAKGDIWGGKYKVEKVFKHAGKEIVHCLIGVYPCGDVIMRLGWLEKFLIKNPLRPIIQSTFEARQILKMGGACPNAKALEIGCGRGGGIKLLFDLFGVHSVDAFDLDFDMISIATKDQIIQSDSVNLWVGNARHIPAPDATYGAVFDFGALHHVHDWQAAVFEIARVIQPGGRFYIEEITRQFIVHPLWRRILDHPQENRFDRDDLNRVLETAGFKVCKSRQFAGLFIWCIADKLAS